MSADPKSLAHSAINTAQTIQRPTNGVNKAYSANSNSSSPDEQRDDDASYEKHESFRPTDEFVAGLSAAFINTTVLFPINKLIFRQMAGGHGAQFAAGQMKEEGIRYLYRGILPPLIQKMVSISIMFGSYKQYKKWADESLTQSSPIYSLIVASCLTGATEAILTPLERIQMLLQDKKFNKDYKHTIDALIRLKKFGAFEYYRGLTCVLLRNGPSNILYFGLRDEIKKLMLNWSDKFESSRSENLPILSTKALLILSQQQNHNQQMSNDKKFSQLQQREDKVLFDFLSGAILGTFISTLFYPLSVVRTRMQTRAPGTQFLSIIQATKAVYNERDRKLSRLFHGCSINCIRQFISWGIINCSYEYLLAKLHEFK